MKEYLVYLMGAAYILAGINHFVNPGFYNKMVRNFLPYPEAIVIVSGVFEILCGLGLMFPATRQIAAWGTIALLVSIFPANINMAIHSDQWNISTIGLYVRLPIQLLLIWWAYIYTKP